jgi:ketose-bisphosphate aldolase
MPLVPIDQLVKAARAQSYALGYFESWNLESLQGVLDAAEATRSPIIIGFNGAFLSGKERRTEERLHWYAQLGRVAAETATVPCGLIFNECPADDWVMLAATLGFNLVMLADPSAELGEYSRRVTTIAVHAHRHGAAVEAELGELPCFASGNAVAKGDRTDPEVAARFVQETGVDLLAVSVGNVHIMLSGRQELDLDALQGIHRRIPEVPLVLHGGTGIGSDSVKRAIGMGVVKVNYGTYLKQRYAAAVRAALSRDQINPHELYGMGGEHDVMVAGRLAVHDAVLERIESLGCCGKASHMSPQVRTSTQARPVAPGTISDSI